MTETKNVQEINDKEAQSVAGGNKAETMEILEFMKAHDPKLYEEMIRDAKKYSIDQYTAAGWMVSSALGIRAITNGYSDIDNWYTTEDVRKDFRKDFTHAEIMARLREKYGV